MSQPQAPHIQELLARHLTPQKIQVDGVKAIPFDEVAQRFTPLVGRDVTIGELMETANSVTALYKERGYALSFAFVPAQTFENDVVRITVVEGYVADVKVKGDPGPAEKRIRAIADRIRADRPLRQDTFERYVNVLGLTPGVNIADVGLFITISHCPWRDFISWSFGDKETEAKKTENI